MYAEGIFLKSPRVEHGRSLPLSFLFKVVCVCVFMYVCATCVEIPSKAREGVRSPEAEITSSCEWPNVGPDSHSLKKQKGLLTVGSSFQLLLSLSVGFST